MIASFMRRYIASNIFVGTGGISPYDNSEGDSDSTISNPTEWSSATTNSSLAIIVPNIPHASLSQPTTSVISGNAIKLAGAVIAQPGLSNAGGAAQFLGHSYTNQSEAGSNVLAAWQYSTGQKAVIALIDDGFDPVVTAKETNFNSALSVNFGAGGPGFMSEPTGSFHGTATSSEIGAAGINGQAIGVAPGTTIIGVRVSFGDAPTGEFAIALGFAASVASVVNNSWTYAGFGVGEPNDPNFRSWYAALANALQTARSQLGAIVVFAAGNNRSQGADLAFEPITANPGVIAVAATDSNGQVTPYSDPGAGLLVAAIGNNITLPAPGGTSTTTDSGTSFAAPIVSGIVGLMLSANSHLGWRDVQEILADSAYAPQSSADTFTTNGATTWNGGGMHFSNDLGFGVVDANVAVNLARAWNKTSEDSNLLVVSASDVVRFLAAHADRYLSFISDLRIQHVQVTINDTDVLVAHTHLVLVSPRGTHSVLMNATGTVGSTDYTGGLDLNNTVITSNAFWGENAAGVWSLLVEDGNGTASSAINNWSLTVWGDNAASVATPLVYTPEFATLVAADPTLTVVSPSGSTATTIDLIALPDNTAVNLNGGPGLIDGITVTVGAGLHNANANGSTGLVTLTGLTSGGSILTGGDAISVLNGSGGDTINCGLGTTSVNTGNGGSDITMSSLGASQVSITSGGGDAIHVGLADAIVHNAGTKADTIYLEGGNLSFIGGSAANIVYTDSGYVLIQGAAGGSAFTVSSAGPGQTTIALGGAADIVAIQAGSGVSSELIQGFRVGTDHLTLLGYASNIVPSVLQAQTSDGNGGTVLGLTDGLRLDFAGIDQLTLTAFV